MDDEIKPVESYDLVGGSIALDLVNTATARTGGTFRDRLHDYGDLVTWAERAADVTPVEAAGLRELARREPAEAALVLEHARQLREAAYRAFSAQFHGRDPDADDLSILNDAYAAAVSHRVLVRAADGVDFEWRSAADLNRPLWPAAIDALELLVSDTCVRVKECATEHCNWLFIDASKNRSRRWCEMKECGNRAKARRHYRRKTELRAQ